MNRPLFFVLCAFSATLAAQQPGRPLFEVASVKVSKTGLPGPIWSGSGPGRLAVDGITAANLIRNAYDLRPEEIIGGPSWLDAERFQINATYPPESGTPQVNAMLRSLLEDRFALKARRDRRELPKYRLVLADANGRLGPQIKKSAAQCGRGEYDLTLSWSRGNNDVERPSIFTALQEQLRLKLEPTRGPVDVLVIDSVERPTPD